MSKLTVRLLDRRLFLVYPSWNPYLVQVWTCISRVWHCCSWIHN